MHNMLIILHSSIGNRNLFLKMHKLWFKMHNRSLKNPQLKALSTRDMSR